jgi:protease-4
MLRRSRWRALLALLAVSVLWLPASLAAPEKKASKGKKDADEKGPVVAHIHLSGSLGESPPPIDPFTGGSAENFRHKLERLHEAARDKHVAALFLEIDGLSVGWGKLDELTKAVAEVRKSGKKVYAYLESADNSKEYLLALACDEVCMPESGWLMLTGLRAEVVFFKELLDKVGLKADMLQMGDFKSAAEPFTRTRMSEPARKQLTAVLDDYYENEIIQRIVRCREGKKLTAEQVKKLIDDGPYAARAAHKAGLIDWVDYRDRFVRTVRHEVKGEHVKVDYNYKQKKHEDVDFSDFFAILKLLAPPKSRKTKDPTIAVIYAVGAITNGKGGDSILGEESCGAKTMVKAIRQAENDDKVKAIVLRVDSPGGSALASDMIWHELKRCKKPVIASMSDVAASGGYYISMAASKIYAEPGTLTGSIGVVGGKIATKGLFDKIGVRTEVIARGANVNILSSDTPFSPSEREKMTTLMQDVYDQFIDKALEGRKKAGKKMTREELLGLAGGRIWTGRQAKEKGLIDELGSLEDAIAAAKVQAGLPADKDVDILMLPHSRSFFDSLIESKSESRLQLPAELRLLPELVRKLRGLGGMLQLRGEPVLLSMPYHVEIR